MPFIFFQIARPLTRILDANNAVAPTDDLMEQNQTRDEPFVVRKLSEIFLLQERMLNQISHNKTHLISTVIKRIFMHITCFDIQYFKPNIMINNLTTVNIVSGIKQLLV